LLPIAEILAERRISNCRSLGGGYRMALLNEAMAFRTRGGDAAQHILDN
jgi:hypothetical protein